VLKAPGTKRLKLKYNELLSNFTFKFDLCRYNEVHATCRQAEMTGLEPSMGPAQGGTRVTATGTNLGSGPPDAGCLFGKAPSW
jgi:hypothetical protein